MNKNISTTTSSPKGEWCGDKKNQINWLLQEKYSGKLTSKAKKDIERLRAGEPVDYLIGFMNFLDCKIDLSKKPLIPRIETEHWAGKVIDEILYPSTNQARLRQNIRVLDMFSGSGAIGIAVLKHISLAKAVFADSEKNCLYQIKVNCIINKISKDRYKIVKSDVYKNISGKFDYILANPPYIPIKRTSKIQKSVLKYEPHAALFGGKNGLFYISEFLLESKNFLNPNGKIFMEFDSIQKKQIEKLLKKINYKSYQFEKDQYNKWRYLSVINTDRNL